MESPKSLILKVRFKPEAKKPPNGAINEANVARAKTWNWTGVMEKVVGRLTPSGSGMGRVYCLGMKTGLGLHSKPVQMLAPRSCGS
jgi:hypothetical protein